MQESTNPDGVQPEHLKYGGQMIIQWLTQVLNRILDLETIPHIFKHSTIVPVRKGKGRNPLSSGSYRGISLVSAQATVMEIVMLNWIQPILQEQGMLHQFRTAYCKISCADAISANMESIMHYTNQGDRIYMCAYDLWNMAF